MNEQHLLDTVGNTPLVRLERIAAAQGIEALLYAKLERGNPGGSSKDRVAQSIIADAERTGRLQPGGTIVESTSGNTGVGLALIAACRGYRVILTMPDNMSTERRKILSALGAQLELTKAAEGMAGAVRRAAQICAATKNSILAGQFENPANPDAHYRTTGPEIWRDSGGQVDALVACVGTGGTLSGTGRYLKQQNPQIRVFAVEPAESPLLSGGCAGAHGIQGIGANFIPKTLDRSILDGVLTVATADAIAMTRRLAKEEGALCGVSSGAALCAAMRLAQEPAWAGKRIVVILPDTGERYLTGDIFV